tara:strand:+ start:123 stop:464 length:342 start_codon:yes stop_codon:yes gene_type:complete
MKIINKPWGKEELLEKNKKYMMKRLTMYKGCRCSLQFHEYKTETILIISGCLKITTGKNVTQFEEKIFYPGDSITIKKNIIHRMEAIEECVYIEASTPEIDDVIRLKDDYKRD